MNLRCSLLAALALGLSSTCARAQWSTDATVERFSWHEHTFPIEVREMGPRFALGAGITQPRTRGLLLAYRGRVYFGTVDYNGSFQFDASKAAHGASSYLGTTQGAELRYRWPSAIDALAGIDFDVWRRRFSTAQREDYRFVSARLGAERVSSATSPFIAGGGIRFLLASGEDATITDSGGTYRVSLAPGLGSNPFLHLGYRIGPRLTLLAYWDGMRLGRSNEITPAGRPSGIIFQPETDMDMVGVRVVYGGGG